MPVPRVRTSTDIKGAAMIALILTLVVLGLILYLIKAYIPMDPIISTLITVVIVLCVIVYLLRMVGVMDLPVPRFR